MRYSIEININIDRLWRVNSVDDVDEIMETNQKVSKEAGIPIDNTTGIR